MVMKRKEFQSNSRIISLRSLLHVKRYKPCGKPDYPDADSEFRSNRQAATPTMKRMDAPFVTSILSGLTSTRLVIFLNWKRRVSKAAIAPKIETVQGPAFHETSKKSRGFIPVSRRKDNGRRVGDHRNRGHDI
jgi:hypothetical protein